jgi:hypothetical protein
MASIFRSDTDWARLDAMTDEDVTAAALSVAVASCNSSSLQLARS